MGRRRPRDPGRPTLLSPDVEDRLIEATKAGSPMSIAAPYAGISERAFVTWMSRGRDEEANRADGLDPNPEEQPYLDLYTKIIEARSAAAVQSVVLIRRAAQGGAITEETKRKYRDENGQLVEETTVKRSAPDWRAAAWYLERQHRSQFGKAAELAVEVTGAGGGPVQISVDASALAERVQRNIAELTAATAGAITAGREEPIDAEVVE